MHSRETLCRSVPAVPPTAAGPGSVVTEPGPAAGVQPASGDDATDAGEGECAQEGGESER